MGRLVAVTVDATGLATPTATVAPLVGSTVPTGMVTLIELPAAIEPLALVG